FTAVPKRGVPGSVVSIYGSNLAASIEQAQAAPLPVLLGGASVTIDGRAAPLFYASPGLIKLQVPYENPPGLRQVVVKTAQGSSLPAAMLVQAAAPNVLADPNTAHAIALNQDGSYNTPDRPAAPGTALTLFLTGQGAVTDGPATGAAATGAATV